MEEVVGSIPTRSTKILPVFNQGAVTQYTYYPDGQVKTVARQLTTSSPATWETTQYTYTLSGNLSTVTDPAGSTTTTTYDINDRVRTVTQQVTATENRQRTYSYDVLGRLHQVSDTTSGAPGTVLETHSYTPNGKKQSFTDGNGHSITYSYDGFDRLDHRTYPDQTTDQYQYDANSNIQLKTTRSGQTIGFIYDPLNRVSTKTPQGEAAGQVTYGYDLTGRLLQASDGSSDTPYVVGYDTAGRANSYTDQQGRNTQVQYDGVGNRTRLQWPAGTNGQNAYFVTYQHDPMNRLTDIFENGSSANLLAHYDWDSLSRQTLVTYGDGTTDAYGQYDGADNLQTLTQTFGGADNNVTFSYGWNGNHQRKSVGVNNIAFQYIPSPGTMSYTSADVNNGYTSSTVMPSGTGTTYIYDNNRNLTSDGKNTLAYDVENRLIQAENAAWGTSQYSYDPLGNRKQKQVGDVITQFLLAGGEEIADYNGEGVGTPWALTVRGVGGLPVAAITPPTGNQSESIAYYHHDILGSTVAATATGIDGAAEVYTYSEFGAPVGGSLPYQFAGYRYDNETGLYYVRARYYSPDLGRFLQPDPIETVGGTNLYAYVNNDPINLTDSLGLCPDSQPHPYVDKFGNDMNDPANWGTGSCYPNCVRSRQEQQEIAINHEKFLIDINPPSVPNPPPVQIEADTAHTALAGSYTIPVGPTGVVVSVPVAVVPYTGEVYLGIGGGVGIGGGLSGGIVHSPGDVGQVLSGTSETLAGHKGILGLQGTVSPNGYAVGNSAGSPGISLPSHIHGRYFDP